MNTGKRHYVYESIVIFIFINSLGFPGNYMLVLGDGLGKVVDYSCFFLEIFMILFSSAERFLEIKIFNFKKEYTSIYLFLIFTVVDSLLMAVSPKEEIITLVRLSVTALFALWVCDFFPADRILKMFCKAHSFFIMATLVFTLLFPSMTIRVYRGEADYIGIFDSKNNCATEIAIGIAMMVLCYRYCREHKQKISVYYYIVMLVQLVLLTRCSAVGAWFTALIPVAYVLVQNRIKILERIQIGWAFLISSIVFLISAVTILPLFSDFFELLGKDATLTGRVPLWNYALQVMAQNNALTGYGYGMFWRNEKAVALIQEGFSRDSFLGNLTTGSHNLLIEMWMSVGLIGLAFFFFMILDCMKKSYEIEETAYLFCCTFFIVFTIKGLTERLLSSAYTYDVLMLFLALAMGCSKRTNKKPAWKRLHCQVYDEKTIHRKAERV